MKEKTSKIFLIILAVLLAASIFFNGWLLHEKTVQTAPENLPGIYGEPCEEDSDCPGMMKCINTDIGRRCETGLPF